ncbi:MAG TPA: SMC-Scp complex subunit ScpB, partial [bacterium]|nr:SMC-Scp complex subunit ScpB [bacterium]
GVNSDGVMQTLLERKLIAITGRDEGQGRALLFSTTKEFLLYFGIDDIADLPKPKEIEELLASGEGQKIIQEIPEEEILEQEVAAENSLDSEFVAAPDPESAVAADQAASTESIPADDAH